MTTQLAKRDELPLDAAHEPPQGLSLRNAWDAVVKGDMTSERLTVMKDLLAMNAEKEFAQAFVRLQQELPVLNGARGIPDKSGKVKYKYANFEDIDAEIRPLCLRNGFTYSFREGGIDNGRIMTIMTLQHAGGHHRDIPCSVRIGSGPPGASESQADMSGHTYGKRGALIQGLALRIVGDREDARMEGGPVSEDLAFEFERRVNECGMKRETFLKYAGVAGVGSYKDIPSASVPRLEEILRKKEAGR